ncbi:hypothetical protein BDV27DRAFT_134749 [Aspergillus caelatus]|uniref:Uncharacterized protein n=1 Tax=Aspergillus caelatus TaxID=61420 RepID=A0A5N6ZRR0_9EURO|nr:uncharacterized protein BDV27DRAFT_134749 [Aspergillus caelatus]KAE8360317.1 hypothetical protein BDV27DRAFT_134749 [Aspergillus caelatus]
MTCETSSCGAYLFVSEIAVPALSYVGLLFDLCRIIKIKPLVCPVEYARYVDGLRTIRDNDAG